MATKKRARDEEPAAPEEPGEAPAATVAAEQSMDELYARATELKVRGRAKMSRDELLAAIALAELDGGLTPEVDEPGGDDPEGTKPQVATENQAQKIFAASTAQLEFVAQDPEFPAHLKALVVQELGRRASRAQAVYDREKAQGPMERFRVTVGGRFVTRDGFLTELVAGSVVTAATHDLAEVRRQGLQIEPCNLVLVRLDEMGKQISEVR